MLSREKRIEHELSRISIYFEELDENKKAMIEPLLQNAAFMRIALEDLQEEISKEGPVEQYKNGNQQYGMKQSAALQAFNSTIKNYAAVIKTLTGFLPAKAELMTKLKALKKDIEEPEESSPGFQSFDSYVEDYEARKRRGELTEKELEYEKNCEERNRLLEEAARLQRKEWEREGRPGYSK
jgi:cell fate (sporulation/competence/biofilm development) regulator YlbF (YheA/YmcA/DUF963 family)